MAEHLAHHVPLIARPDRETHFPGICEELKRIFCSPLNVFSQYKYLYPFLLYLHVPLPMFYVLSFILLLSFLIA